MEALEKKARGGDADAALNLLQHLAFVIDVARLDCLGFALDGAVGVGLDVAARVDGGVAAFVELVLEAVAAADPDL